jgi:hypothetical protein
VAPILLQYSCNVLKRQSMQNQIAVPTKFYENVINIPSHDFMQLSRRYYRA